jgi:hypothetical protein
MKEGYIIACDFSPIFLLVNLTEAGISTFSDIILKVAEVSKGLSLHLS